MSREWVDAERARDPEGHGFAMAMRRAYGATISGLALAAFGGWWYLMERRG